ncbi:DNA polymerase epsilon catalytic subunit A [Porphyridium purpureum]|uniref:DNA-directed DNA polymerase n=1 Tax=Porphyridium purpureum TaxID=35688 RepID=A0A5J4Z272_PORPP|nr:DNA polymerase epsilon catalytic subunit A [Porphyridium purpureum]|eukprot:POR5263..scf295_1
MRKQFGNGNSRYRQAFGGGSGAQYGGFGASRDSDAPASVKASGEARPEDAQDFQWAGSVSAAEQRAELDAVDARSGYELLPSEAAPRLGWLLNMVPSTVQEPASRKKMDVVDLFFLGADGRDFRATLVAHPYFYLAAENDQLVDVEAALRRSYAELIVNLSHVELNDLSQLNHLASESSRAFLKVELRSSRDLTMLKRKLMPYANAHKQRQSYSSSSAGAGSSLAVTLNQRSSSGVTSGVAQHNHALSLICDIREHDVAPVNRVAIDLNVRAGYWYNVLVQPFAGAGGNSSAVNDSPLSLLHRGDTSAEHMNTNFKRQQQQQLLTCSLLERVPSILQRAVPTVLAYDIETSKAPLKFPDAHSGDQVVMISWMTDGQGYLGVNRALVSADIADFEYSPSETFRGEFECFNERDEKALLERFFASVRACAPRIFVTYNGDSFDWPFVQARAGAHGLSMWDQIGMVVDEASGECRGRGALHLDCFHWVNRDSYLPQGSRGLKAVTRTLLGYDPLELDPEEMMPAARERPQLLASYSVSDAVCTYYLFTKYVQPFVFSLANIIPLCPDDVLRKGSGTLCESLLMSEARERCIVAPDKVVVSGLKQTHDGALLESETYIGGHVEALQCGIFRSDLPMAFEMDPEAIAELEASVDELLAFFVRTEARWELSDVSNYADVRAQILNELQGQRERPVRTELPLIYHLDVGAMYPNIILTNRLQPNAMVTDEHCAACDFNGMSDCQRSMAWTWRGETYPVSRGELEMVYRTMANDSSVPADASPAQREDILRSRLKEYSRRVYKRALMTSTEARESTVCQRENPFYVDTVRAFRDRRYEYKELLKQWKKKLALAQQEAAGESEGTTAVAAALQEARSMVVLYDSMQLAHKAILNSFYGYVMRKGARWYSMEMAGIVTLTGAQIIKQARELIERIGVALELDTDGIWCTIPASFPDSFELTHATSGKKCTMSFLCTVFNYRVNQQFSNHQYQTLAENGKYKVSSECSIYFEVDGPYRAMVLPASKEEGKSIKKRYAVFNADGSLAELKGFEIKRRGELKLIKIFQGDIFGSFLAGTDLTECYASVATLANRWLDVLDQHGAMLTDDELLELLVEQNNMSRALHEYIKEQQKSCAITCAKRIADFLGDDMVKDKGLACKYVIAKRPFGTQVTERPVPVDIFKASPAVRARFLKRWLRTHDEQDTELRELIDWDYYRVRLGSAILKIISIPAVLQGVANPVPRVALPDWLIRRQRELESSHKQATLDTFLVRKLCAPKLKPLADVPVSSAPGLADMEDLGARNHSTSPGFKVAVVSKLQSKRVNFHPSEDPCSNENTDNCVPGAPEQIRKNHIDPDISDYSAWLQVAKQKWLAGSNATISPRMIGVASAKGTGRVNAASSRKRARELAFNPVSVSEDGIPDTRKRRLKGLSLYFSHAGNHHQQQQGPNGYEPFSSNAGEPTKSTFGLLRTGSASATHNNLLSSSRTSNTLMSLSETRQCLLSCKWHVIKVEPASAGVLKYWVLPYLATNTAKNSFRVGTLTALSVAVPRVLYVNCFQEQDHAFISQLERLGIGRSAAEGHVKCELSDFELPRSRTRHFLYRIELSEAIYQEMPLLLADWMRGTSSGGAIEGVYGRGSTMIDQAILRLGGVIAPRHAALLQRKQKGVLNGSPVLQPTVWDLNELDDASFVQAEGRGKSAATLSYLFKSRSFLQYVHVLEHWADDQSGRGAVVFMHEPTQSAVVIMAGASQGMHQTTIEPVALFQNALFAHKNGRAGGDGGRNSTEALEQTDAAGWKVELEIAKSVAEAKKSLASRLFSLIGERDRSQNVSDARRTILCVHSRRSAEDVKADFSALRSFPIVHMSLPVRSSAGSLQLPALRWESPLVSTLFAQYFARSTHLQESVPLARLAGIPLANLGEQHDDVHVHALDTMYARQLHLRKLVPWTSRTRRPDLAGYEGSEMSGASEQADAQALHYAKPGMYRTVCFDVEVQNLVVTAITRSAQFGDLHCLELEHARAKAAAKASGRAPAQQHRKPSFSVDSLCSSAEGKSGGGRVNLRPLDTPAIEDLSASLPSFLVLREMVSAMENGADCASDDHSGRGSAASSTASALLQHVARWVNSTHALMYEPGVVYFVRSLQKRVFALLVAEFSRLGASVVFATSRRLMLATRKTSVSDAVKYVGFLERTVRAHNVLSKLRFAPILGVYVSLAFADPLNYVALPANEQERICSGDVAGVHQEQHQEHLKHAVRDGADGIVRDLSKEVGEVAMTAKSLFLQKYVRDMPSCTFIWQHGGALALGTYGAAASARREWMKVANYMLRQPLVLHYASQAAMPCDVETSRDEGGAPPRQVKFGGLGLVPEARQVFGELAPLVVESVSALLKCGGQHRPGRDASENEEEAVGDSLEDASSSARRLKLALDFILDVCRLFELDSSLEAETSTLRRHLLSLVGAREFSLDDHRRDHLASSAALAGAVYLEDVLCLQCGELTDLYLACDASDLAKSGRERDAEFTCSWCRAPFRTEALEMRLLGIVRGMLQRFFIQDVRCEKCGLVSRDSMNICCSTSCAGALRLGEDYVANQKVLLKIHSLARTVGMRVLESLLDFHCASMVVE